MTRHRQRLRWRTAIAVGAVYGLALAGNGWAADPAVPRSGSEQPSGRSSSEADSDESFQSLGVSTVKSGSSTTAIRKQALAELPLDRLTDEARGKAESLVKNLGMFRRLPTLSFEVDPEVYGYFVRNPDVAVATWRAMEISKFKLKAAGPNRYTADAGDGSVGQIELLLQSPEDTLIHCDGAFKSPLLPKPIIARSLMRLQTSFAKEPDGRIIGTHSGDVFVEFPSQAVETVAKAISPVSHTIADRNFKQMTLFAHLMSQAMARHPGWIEVIGKKLDGIGAERKQEFLEVSARSHAMSRKRLNAAAPSPLFFSPDVVLTPFRESHGASTYSFPLNSLSGTATLRD
jgi:hypothetical protein